MFSNCLTNITFRLYFFIRFHFFDGKCNILQRQKLALLRNVIYNKSKPRENI